MNNSSNNKFKYVNKNNPTWSTKTQSPTSGHSSLHLSGQSKLNPYTSKYIKSNAHIPKALTPAPQPSTCLTNVLKVSNSLDDLLKRCNQIGNSQQNKDIAESKNNSLPNSNTPNHTKPINDRSKFKINKNFKTSVSSSTNFIPATSTPYTSKFKMNHKTITIPYPIRNVTPVNSSQYKYSPSCNQYIKSQSLLANGNISNLSSDVNTNKNKYKISNVTEENKFKTNSVFNTSENKFKFVKNPTSQNINSSLRKRISSETRKLLAIRRSKYIRSENLKMLSNRSRLISSTSATLHIINRYKLKKSTKRNNHTFARYPSQKITTNTSMSKKNTKYKLINMKGESYLNNKYISYTSSLISSANSYNKQYLASNLIQKSIMTINRNHQSGINKMVINYTSIKASSSSKSKKSTGYCLFYNRFGRCSRGDKCGKIHDPKRIATCPRFLRGTCQQEACPFSHIISVEKMPLCSHFAKGRCNRENCPYSHVFCGKNAQICMRFARDGFCALGTKCDRAHVNECSEFVESGKCSKGKECPFFHRTSKMNRTTNVKLKKKESPSNEPKLKNISADFGDSFIQFESHSQSENESLLNLSQKEKSIDQTNESTYETDSRDKLASANLTPPKSDNGLVLKTRPSFGLRKNATT